MRWRYRIVADGMAVVVPADRLGELARIPGVARVWPSLRYRPTLDRTPALIGAPALWGPNLSDAGQGLKIAVIDQGIDPKHPFFDPTGFSYPPGFPKGNTTYTTPKIIVARSFVPAGVTAPESTLPFVGIPDVDDHGTHVAGIAAGDNGTLARAAGDAAVRVSGIAPKAYLGNYKAMAVPTPQFGLNGNSPELVAAIESAVSDGMNVINMSLGEAEIDPRRDIVVHALDAAAAAGVVPVVSAGNDLSDFGFGSISSPANAPRAIAVGASTGGHGSGAPDRPTYFSSAGPTEFSYLLKPDVTAPGAAVLSSVPANEGSWGELSGTSMAAPHVAGAAALLLQRHPSWTVAQVKSALVQTGVPVRSRGRELSPIREGGGRIALAAANDPRLFAAPTSVSFGLFRPARAVRRTVALTDAGGGAGRWTVSLSVRQALRGVRIAAARTVSAPGRLSLRAAASASAAAGDAAGFVVLRRQGIARRIPFWLHVERPLLELDPALVLRRTGLHRGTTAGAGSRVASYRYPTTAPGQRPLLGPEAVYRFRLRRPVQNFGVVVTARAAGVAIEPRIVRGADENRLAGYTALPLDVNNSRATSGDRRLVAGALRPVPGLYSVVFDSPRGARRGGFAFRFWVDDTAPPTIRIVSVGGRVLRLAIRDGGSGVDPQSIHVIVGGVARHVSFARGVACTGGVAGVARGGVPAGTQSVVARAADYQETKNTENAGPILPNTRVLRTTVAVR